jgi:hypothetical protein
MCVNLGLERLGIVLALYKQKKQTPLALCADLLLHRRHKLREVEETHLAVQNKGKRPREIFFMPIPSTNSNMMEVSNF